MNAEVAYGYRERKSHAEAMGEVAHRLHCLQHLKLKTVIKVIASAPHPWQTLAIQCAKKARNLHDALN